MKLLDPTHPFFDIAWRRWATCLFPAVWALIELYGGHPGWAVMFGAVAAYAFWILIVTYPKA